MFRSNRSFNRRSSKRWSQTPAPFSRDVEYIRSYGRFRGYSRKFSTPSGDYTLASSSHCTSPRSFWNQIRQTFALDTFLWDYCSRVSADIFWRVNALAPRRNHEQASIAHRREEFARSPRRAESARRARSSRGVLQRTYSIGWRPPSSSSAALWRMLRTSCGRRWRSCGGRRTLRCRKPIRAAAEYRESMVVLRDTARGLGQIVEDLFTLARADAGNYPVAKYAILPRRNYLPIACAPPGRSRRVKNVVLELQSESDLLIEADEGLITPLDAEFDR